ncbi:mitochondrial substrate carrier family protein C-like [Sesamum indicum]|uniref:Mitochondrial substrate carrier family protein C-like n=1 Tax=Sesamum indicum TaxID=4182 RepID=A0A6I9V2U4_SESIN|nr:mitochondrial substrate carrier family protein C-like [Sesamum indicum]XP_020547252.1 mitochondrial substrate carrier family protein C-like [Sesamum indicum]
MVVSGNDPLESFLNSVQVVKTAFSPLESNFRKVARSFQHCCNGVSQKGKLSRAVDDADGELVAARLNVKNKSGQRLVFNGDGDDPRKGKFPMKILLGIFKEECGSNDHCDTNVSHDWGEKLNENMWKKGLKQRYGSGKEDGNGNFLHFEMALLSLINGFLQAFSNVKVDVKQRVVGETKLKELKVIEEKNLQFEYLIGFVFNKLSHFPKFGADILDHKSRNTDRESSGPHFNQFGCFKALTSIYQGKRADVNGFFGNLKFAKVGGMPSSIVGVPSTEDVREEGVNQEDIGGLSPPKLTNGVLSIPLSNVEQLRSTLSTVSLTELIELLPQIGRSSKEDHPDKKKQFSVQDFFRYTEAEGKRFFQELDRDGDGQVTLEDLEIAMRNRKLPNKYAHQFMQRTRNHLFSKSFGWKQFLSLMEQKEPTILRAYTSLRLSKSRTLQKSEILASLENAGLPANEDNAVAMMHFLNANTDESVSYGHFRNFMLLLPSDRLQVNSRSIPSKSATAGSASPVDTPAVSVLKSSLAGGISCSLSAALMHPLDTVKTRVQASTLSFPEILAKLPQLGVRGLYLGSIPAILGQFSSHGLRTGIFEASKFVLINVAPTLPEVQVQSVLSFVSTFLGTAMRIPCEVLKQRLQAGLYDNVGEALVETWRQDGLRGFFRGTGMTLCREIPFYVAGTGLYTESKKAVQQLVGRELKQWETIAVGAITGGLTAVLTTPFDVIKTRMMTASQGQPVALSVVALSILQYEGPFGFFKGAVPRFFWVAPLGAMNFAGYELIRKAMDRTDENSEAVVPK